ncbi:MAG: 50S ribosomal protein L2, partial [Candidatus Dojkabacteria bacterium]|nr:50S ribosomal protein L2 [Candidatus Dojkabacteria bacterium]
MALKTFKPTTPSLRGTVLIDRSSLYKGEPFRALVKSIKQSAGRNNQGKITVRHRGGGVKKLYRIIDFKRDKRNIQGLVERIEYDPNRTAFIALIKYPDGEWRYILAPDGLKIGDYIEAGENVDIKTGNALPLKNIPQGTYVHAVELYPGKGAQIARSAGTSVQVMGGAKGYIQLKMPSGELRLVRETCYATIGVVSNPDNKNVKLGKAGRNRLKGIRPTVRGVAMSYKHPHGGGQGKAGRHGT